MVNEWIRELCPTGFRFLTNATYVERDGSVNKDTIQLIRVCRDVYGDVAVTDAFDISNHPIGTRLDDLGKIWLAIHIKRATPVRPKVDVTNQCGSCHKYYLDRDIVVDGKGYVYCLNCLTIYSYDLDILEEKGIFVNKW